MITFVQEPYNFDAHILINTVNCVGVMGKGIALEFKKRYEKMYKAYRSYCHRGEILPGGTFFWVEPGGKVIYNVATKNHWKDPSSLPWIQECLDNIKKFLGLMDEAKLVSLPALGCGNGGLNWADVKPMIEKSLGIVKQSILVFEPYVK